MRALSSLYVERRGEGALASRATDGRGKRAALACHYAALHFLTLQHALAAGAREGLEGTARVVDLGCGTGAAGAAVAAALDGTPPVLAIDRSGWALGEARHTHAAFGVRGRTRRGVLPGALPRLRPDDCLVLGWFVNECEANARAELLAEISRACRQGTRLLLAEPLAGAAAPWWSDWAATLEPLGVRSSTVRAPIELPAFLAETDRATGLRHRELRARVLHGPETP